MSNLRFLNELSVDSLKIRIPIESVTKVNNAFDEIRHIVTDDAEIIETFKNDSYKIDNNGIKTHYLIQDMRVSKTNSNTFLVILFNSKLLQNRYLEGINSKNIRYIYDELIKQGIVYFEYDVFLKSPITDVDIKRDTYIREYSTMVNVVYEYSKLDKRAHHGCSKFSMKNNFGIQWSDRRKATVYNPYLKIYHKGIELRYKSVEFYDTYIKNKVDEDYLDYCMRTEFTLKNKKHFDKYKIENTLSGLLNKSQVYLMGTLKMIVEKHINRIPKQRNIVPDELTSSEQKCLNSMEHFLTYHKNLGFNGFLKMFTKNLSERTKRRTIKNCEFLYENYILNFSDVNLKTDLDNKIEEENAEQLEIFFNDLGI